MSSVVRDDAFDLEPQDLLKLVSPSRMNGSHVVPVASRAVTPLPAGCVALRVSRRASACDRGKILILNGSTQVGQPDFSCQPPESTFHDAGFFSGLRGSLSFVAHDDQRMVVAAVDAAICDQIGLRLLRHQPVRRRGRASTPRARSRRPPCLKATSRDSVDGIYRSLNHDHEYTTLASTTQFAGDGLISWSVGRSRLVAVPRARDTLHSSRLLNR